MSTYELYGKLNLLFEEIRPLLDCYELVLKHITKKITLVELKHGFDDIVRYDLGIINAEVGNLRTKMEYIDDNYKWERKDLEPMENEIDRLKNKFYHLSTMDRE